jgi:hypothetical protein
MSVAEACEDDSAAALLAASVASYALNVAQSEIVEGARGSAQVAFAR